MAEYIARKMAYKLIKEQREKETGAYSKGRNKGLIIAGSIINNKEVLPTADVVEVKHSRWENISGFDVCNICGTSPAYCEPKPNNPKGYPPYCHNCGAKMDGGKAE